MKKVYISPELFIEHVELQHIICNSITGTGGDAEVGISEEEDPGNVSGDSRRKNNVWDDEEEEW